MSRRWGPTSPARRNSPLSAADAIGTLSQVLRGTIPGRQTDADLTIYSPVGLPWQDLALAWAVYRHALATGLGREFDFLA
jgi:ornithine cyclodeaminase